MVLSKMLENVNSVVLYKYKYFICISLTTTNLLILYKVEFSLSNVCSCVKNFPLHFSCTMQESPQVSALCKQKKAVFFSNNKYL